TSKVSAARGATGHHDEPAAVAKPIAPRVNRRRLVIIFSPPNRTGSRNRPTSMYGARGVILIRECPYHMDLIETSSHTRRCSGAREPWSSCDRTARRSRRANGWPLRCTSATALCVRVGHEGLALALAESHPADLGWAFRIRTQESVR